ncbi:MAG: hypothetical protein ACLQFR_21390 [Streptosporangiaceae bacterium]
MMQSSTRKVNTVLAVCGVLAGFGITIGILHIVHRGHSPAAHGPGRGSGVIQSASGGLSPAALDAQWLAYSDHSTCADWAGGDGVSAIRLNSSQIAWFFADTFLGPAGPRIGFSHPSGFLNNSVVMQTTARGRRRLVTLTGGGACPGPGGHGAAASVVRAPGVATDSERYWDADGIRVGGTVVKFYNAYLRGTVPFVPVRTTIASFSVRKLSAAGRGPAYGGVIVPKLTPVPTYTPPGGGTPIVWGSALLRSGRMVYVYGWQSPSGSRRVQLLYLARVRATRLADFPAWRFYADGKWVGSQGLAGPIEPVGQDFNVPSAFSVVRIGVRYWLIQAQGAGDPDIYAYPAPAPWGPFDTDQGILLYHAPGIGLNAANGYRVIYEARAEPALSTSKTLVISYNVNSEAVTAACLSILQFTNAIVQPQFITVDRTAFTAPVGSVQDLVRAVPPAYAKAGLRHPAQWFDAWSFSSGCPPVPGVSGLRAQTAVGLVRLTWPSTGIGMRYRIYLAPGSGSFEYVRTVSSTHVKLTGLTRGLTYRVGVVPVNIHANAGPGGHIKVRIP